MTEGFWKLIAALTVAVVATVGMAWCIAACGEPVYTASDKAEQRCIDEAEAGVGKAAMRANIDACRAAVRAEGGAQ